VNVRPPSVLADFKAVVFDLDGTLYTLKGLGFHITLGLLTETVPLRAVFKVRDEMRGRDFGCRAAFKAAFADSLGKKSGLSPEQALNWYEHRFMGRFIKVLCKRGKVRKGLIPLLETLRKRNIRVGLVSDFGRVEERLSALSIPLSLFDEAVGAEDFGVMKPTAKPFIHFAAKWGIEPSKMILVGDRLDHDEGSAEAAGTAFIGVESRRNKGELFFPWDEVVRRLAAVV
jgi:HAD superfamily hydrolase (TIGR01549 family)